MSKTVVGLFSTMSQANEVKSALVAQGYESRNINVVANDEGDSGLSSSGYEDKTSSYASDTPNYGSTSTSSSSGTIASRTGAAASGAAGMGEKISNFFRNLTGGDEQVHHHYASGVNEGGALVAVTVADEKATEVANLLKQHGARDLEGGYQGAASSGTPVYGSSTPTYAQNTQQNVTGEQAIPIIEEELVVGKREVDRGGVRIYSHITERPVEADVTLHEERINVQRRAVNRPATQADFQAGSSGTIEMTATGEEAVVGKSSRVVEEVVVGKQSSDRTEQIHDTVRKTEVEVENLDATTTSGTTTTPRKGNY